MYTYDNIKLPVVNLKSKQIDDTKYQSRKYTSFRITYNKQGLVSDTIMCALSNIYTLKTPSGVNDYIDRRGINNDINYHDLYGTYIGFCDFIIYMSAGKTKDKNGNTIYYPVFVSEKYLKNINLEGSKNIQLGSGEFEISAYNIFNSLESKDRKHILEHIYEEGITLTLSVTSREYSSRYIDCTKDLFTILAVYKNKDLEEKYFKHIYGMVNMPKNLIFSLENPILTNKWDEDYNDKFDIENYPIFKLAEFEIINSKDYLYRASESVNFKGDCKGIDLKELIVVNEYSQELLRIKSTAVKKILGMKQYGIQLKSATIKDKLIRDIYNKLNECDLSNIESPKSLEIINKVITYIHYNSNKYLGVQQASEKRVKDSGRLDLTVFEECLKFFQHQPTWVKEEILYDSCYTVI